VEWRRQPAISESSSRESEEVQVKRDDWIGAVLFALILLVLCVLPAHCDRDERRYVLVFYSTEIRSISADKNTRLEFPMVDGHPGLEARTID
jgi:hypothetical protein